MTKNGSAFLARKLTVFVLLCIGLSGARASKEPWEEYEKIAGRAQEVEALSAGLLGDSINLQNGALSFGVTDVSLRGNNALRVEFARKFTTKTRSGFGRGNPGSGPNLLDAAMGDWEIDLPNINGVFALSPGWINSAPGQSAKRCSVARAIDARPPSVTVGYQIFQGREIWQGTRINLPGRGDHALLVRTQTLPQPAGETAYWITSDWTSVSCLASIANGSGEGFLATDAEGNKYRFDWMAVSYEQELSKANPKKGVDPSYYFLSRGVHALYATRVEDRFGNWVSYSYSNAASAPVKLDRIESSDGRVITLGYTGGRLSTVSAHGRTWNYGYNTAGALSSVKLPDGSAWAIDLPDFQNLLIKYPLVNGNPNEGDPWRSCTDPGDLVTQAYVGTVKHPAGATGTFTVGTQRFYKDGLDEETNCIKNDPNTTNDDVAIYPMAWDSYSVTSKKLSGPGLADATWAYTYLGGRATQVNSPDGYAKYTYGNVFHDNEGKLLKIERGKSASQILDVQDLSYELAQSGQSFPTPIGESGHDRAPSWGEQYLRPELSKAVTVQGETFTRTNTAFTQFAQPKAVKRSSTLGYERVESIVYNDNLTKWVLGQVESVTCTSSKQAGCPAPSGQVISSATYDPTTATELTSSSFGKLKRTLTYNTNGTVATVKDGRGNITTLSSWKRGIPQLVQFPATPESPSGATVSAVVNDSGWVSSATNEAHSKTCYDYDGMGRVKTITYPSETTADLCDTSAYLATTQVFEPVASTEYDIPAGHWRLTRSTGNARKITYFDGRWRPVVQREYDTANEAATQRIQRFGHDHEGRKIFASQIGAADNKTYGRKFEYDALGRLVKEAEITSAKTDGWVTTTAYLDGFVKSVTNPRNYVTTLSFMALDEPNEEWPVSFDHQSTMRTEVVRNAFGNPTTLTRRNDTDTLHVDRTYAYNSAQELCRRVEPESGATLFGYDASGNLAWSAAGLPAATACEADGTTPAVAARKAARGYDARNRNTSLSFPDGLGNTTTTYTPDNLVDTLTANNAGPWLATTSHTYNKRRLLKQEKLTTPDQPTGWPIDYAYNTYGARASQTWQGLTVSYLPNALGQPTQVGDFATVVKYHPHGAVASFTYGNGVKHTMTPDDRQLPGRSQDVLDTSALLDLSYKFDGNGNVSTITDAVTGGYHSRTNTYDAHDRLWTSVSNVFGTATYTYNDLDQITRVVVGASAQHAARDHYYCYETATRRLTWVRQTSCADTSPLVNSLSYDVQGNLGSKDAATYSFDFGNRMLWSSTGGVQTAYAYDGHGRRVKDSVGSIGRQSQYDAEGKLAYVLDQRAGKGRQHVYLGDDLVAIRDVTISTGVAARRYQHSDALGSPLVVTDGSGAVVEQTRYEPYGQQVNRPMTDGIGFTGHMTDASSGLVYAQQRYYDPSLGLFLSVDPVQADAKTAASFNRYVYGNNNPVKFKDPDGRESVGEFIDRKATEAASAGNRGTTYGWAFARVAWGGFGAEGVSQIANKGIGNASAGDKVSAVLELAAVVPGGKLLGGAGSAAKGVGAIKDGAKLSTGVALDAAVEHLGPGYKEIAPGVFKSADGTRMVRMTNSDLARTSNHAGAPHMNFEAGQTVTKPNGKEQFISKENKHIFLPEEQ